MDLHTVTRYRLAATRDDLALEPGEQFLAGGTWVYSEPQPDVTGLVDLSGMAWPSLDYTADGLTVSATCTIAELARLPKRDGWQAHPLFFQCATGLLASFKIWNVATVGGNICRAYSAASMVALCATLDAQAVVWKSDGTEQRAPVASLMTGNGTQSLARGDVLRAVEIPHRTLTARTGYRKIALSEYGRSGALVTGRLDPDGAALFVITAATLTPTLLSYPHLPSAAELRADVLAAEGYYTDPLGAADWRRQVSAVLLEEIRTEFAS